jgi:queuosine precursor transporter
MALLILAGSAISFALGAGRIAIASAVAFAASETVDTITYALLGNRERLIRVNGSNVASAAVDSFLFPALAFGLPVLWAIVIGQFVAKVFGGALWSVLLTKRTE